MASEHSVAQTLREILHLLDEIDKLQQCTAVLTSEIANLLASTLAGSRQHDADRTVHHFNHLAGEIERLPQTLAQARVGIEEILSRIVRLVGEGATAETTPSVDQGSSNEPNSTKAGSPSKELKPARVRHVDLIRRARQRLGRTPPGAQTSGIWIRDDGTTEELRSGKDTPWYAETFRQLRRIGGPAGRALTRLATHIEVQMILGRPHKDESPEITLVLSRPPCGTPPAPNEPFTCNSQLANLIRATRRDITLTVIDADGRVWTYPREKRSQ